MEEALVAAKAEEKVVELEEAEKKVAALPILRLLLRSFPRSSSAPLRRR